MVRCEPRCNKSSKMVLPLGPHRCQPPSSFSSPAQKLKLGPASSLKQTAFPTGWEDWQQEVELH
eukprot:5863252-Amphidinium_carterae.1